MISNEDVTQAIYDMETTAMGAVNMPHPELHTRGEHPTVQLPVYALVLGTKGRKQPMRLIAPDTLFKAPMSLRERVLCLPVKPRKRN